MFSVLLFSNFFSNNKSRVIFKSINSNLFFNVEQITKSDGFSISINDWLKDVPNQTPIMPMNGFLKSDGMFTSTFNNAKIATIKAGPRTQGRGNNNILKIAPPTIPIIRVLNINISEVLILFSWI